MQFAIEFAEGVLGAAAVLSVIALIIFLLWTHGGKVVSAAGALVTRAPVTPSAPTADEMAKEGVVTEKRSGWLTWRPSKTSWVWILAVLALLALGLAAAFVPSMHTFFASLDVGGWSPRKSSESISAKPERSEEAAKQDACGLWSWRECLHRPSTPAHRQRQAREAKQAEAGGGKDLAKVLDDIASSWHTNLPARDNQQKPTTSASDSGWDFVGKTLDKLAHSEKDEPWTQGGSTPPDTPCKPQPQGGYECIPCPHMDGVVYFNHKKYTGPKPIMCVEYKHLGPEMELLPIYNSGGRKTVYGVWLPQPWEGRACVEFVYTNAYYAWPIAMCNFQAHAWPRHVRPHFWGIRILRGFRDLDGVVVTVCPQGSPMGEAVDIEGYCGPVIPGYDPRYDPDA